MKSKSMIVYACPECNYEYETVLFAWECCDSGFLTYEICLECDLHIDDCDCHE